MAQNRLEYTGLHHLYNFFFKIEAMIVHYNDNIDKLVWQLY